MDTGSSSCAADGRVSRRAFFRSTGFAIGVGAAGIAGFTGTGAATSVGHPTTIDDCTTITASGRYALSDDIDASGATGPCISIQADDVVLDGRRHTIHGGGSGRGVAVGVGDGLNVEQVTVENLEITDCVGAGIEYVDARGGAIRNTSVNAMRDADVGVGILFTGARSVVVTGCKITENPIGVYLTDGAGDNVFARNHIRFNTGHGAFCTEYSRSNVFRGNHISHNGSGISFNDGSSDPVIIGNTVRDNGESGIGLGELTGALVERNLTLGNRGEGSGNSGDGIGLSGVDDCRLLYNLSRHNADDGIELVDSDDNELIRNKVLDNGDGAIVVSGTSSGNTLSGNITR